MLGEEDEDMYDIINYKEEGEYLYDDNVNRNEGRYYEKCKNTCKTLSEDIMIISC